MRKKKIVRRGITLLFLFSVLFFLYLTFSELYDQEKNSHTPKLSASVSDISSAVVAVAIEDISMYPDHINEYHEGEEGEVNEVATVLEKLDIDEAEIEVVSSASVSVLPEQKLIQVEPGFGAGQPFFQSEDHVPSFIVLSPEPALKECSL